MGKQWKQWQTLFSWTPKSLQTVAAVMKLKDTCSLEEKLGQIYCIKKQRYYFADKSWYSQSYGFSSSHVCMWNLNHKEGWAPKNRYFWIVLEKILESPLECKEIKPVCPKGKWKSLNCVWLFVSPWQAPPSMGFPRHGYWNGLPFSSSGDLPDPGIEPGSPSLQAYSLSSEPPGKPKWNWNSLSRV